MKRISRRENPIIAAPVVVEIVQVQVPAVAVPVEVHDVALAGIAVHPDTCKISSITPPIE
mgnify:CR=1 FL=1